MLFLKLFAGSVTGGGERWLNFPFFALWIMLKKVVLEIFDLIFSRLIYIGHLPII